MFLSEYWMKRGMAPRDSHWRGPATVDLRDTADCSLTVSPYAEEPMALDQQAGAIGQFAVGPTDGGIAIGEVPGGTPQTSRVAKRPWLWSSWARVRPTERTAEARVHPPVAGWRGPVPCRPRRILPPPRVSRRAGTRQTRVRFPSSYQPQFPGYRLVCLA